MLNHLSIIHLIISLSVTYNTLESGLILYKTLSIGNLTLLILLYT